MKTINKIFWQTALSLAFVACQNEDIVTENVEQGAKVYTLQGIVGGSNQSRAQVELNRTEVENERFIWNRDDKITLYDINAETTTGNTFRIVESYNDNPQHGNPSGEALFTTETPLIAGHQVTAVYPAQTAEPTDGTITLSIPDKSTIENNLAEAWKKYMRQNMFMYASAVQVNSSTGLTFRHLCAMARITYTNGTGQGIRITKCELESDGKYFATSAKLNVKEGVLNEKTTAKTAGIYFSDRFISPGMAEEIYLLFFPGDDFNNDGKLTIKIYTKGNETPATIDIPVSEILKSNSTAKGFEAGKRYWFQVIQTSNGLIRKSNVAEGTISNTKLISIIQGQLGNEAVLTKDENGFIIVEKSKDALSQVKTIEGDFDNLEDIKYLPNLETLVCQKNWEHPLTKLDVSKNTKLMNLACKGSALTSLDVSNNPELISLNCDDNKLTSLDLSKNTKLQVLNCENNQITSLNLGNHPELVSLNCNDNKLTALDISKSTKIQVLNCWNNQITSLNLGNHPELVSLHCYGNNLTALDISKSTKFQVLNCDNNQITSLNLGNHPELVSLRCYGNKLTILDVSKCTKLENLNCSNNQLTSLDVSNNAALNSLSCYSSGLTSLNLSQNTKLTFLDCEVNNLQSLDVTRLTELRTLYCSNNTQLATLDISRNINLTELNYSYTSIPSLDVSKHAALTYLACGGEKTTSLNISKNTALETLRCENSSLTSLDISKNVNLKTLNCRHSRIKELDITNNPNIQDLQCGDQRNGNSEINMNLILTAAQKTLWDSSWVNETWANANVTPVVKE